MITERRSLVWFILLSVICVVLSILLWVVWTADVHNKNDMQKVNNILFAHGVSAASYASYTATTTDVSANRVYFPVLHIFVPLSDISTTLMFNKSIAYGAQQIVQAGITTHELASYIYDSTPVRDCSSPVRIAFEPKPNPYNPEEIPTTSVSLHDGRTLQVYAYHLKSCYKEWEFTNTNPDELASIFKLAQSY